jgi:tetratricopeptide (TPR) repeat protein
VVCLGFCGRTFARNFDWHDEQSLWTGAARVTPGSYRSHEHLASALMALSVKDKDYDTADRHAAQSLAILAPLPDKDKVAVAYSTAGMVYRLTGDARGQNGGADWYRKAVQVLLEGARVDQVWDREFAYQNKLVGKTTGQTHFVKVYLELARAYRDLGQYKESLDALNPSHWTDPQPEFFEEASATFLSMGDSHQGVIALMEGIAMGTAEQQRLAAEVVDTYRTTAAASCALEGEGEKAGLNFNCPQVREDFCYAHRNAAAMFRQLHRDGDASKVIDSAERGLGCPAEMMR